MISTSDENECELTNRCDRDAECINTPGSYQCKCNTGYAGDGHKCSGNLVTDSVVMLLTRLRCVHVWNAIYAYIMGIKCIYRPQEIYKKCQIEWETCVPEGVSSIYILYLGMVYHKNVIYGSYNSNVYTC